MPNDGLHRKEGCKVKIKKWTFACFLRLSASEECHGNHPATAKPSLTLLATLVVREFNSVQSWPSCSCLLTSSRLCCDQTPFHACPSESPPHAHDQPELALGCRRGDAPSDQLPDMSCLLPSKFPGPESPIAGSIFPFSLIIEAAGISFCCRYSLHPTSNNTKHLNKKSQRVCFLLLYCYY